MAFALFVFLVVLVALAGGTTVVNGARRRLRPRGFRPSLRAAARERTA